MGYALQEPVKGRPVLVLLQKQSDFGVFWLGFKRCAEICVLQEVHFTELA